MNFFKTILIFLLKIIDFKIDSKLSSNNIISEDSLAYSAPEIPIENPISDYFRARASLLSSPVAIFF